MDSSFTDLIRAQLSIDAVALAKAHADVQVSEGNIFDHGYINIYIDTDRL
jgi:hypothetical protein